MSADFFSGLVSDEIMKQLTEHARLFRESGAEPATPRRASTVVLIQEDHSVFLIRRLRGMAFGGMWAFPGGSLEDGETPAEAAVREVQEETGVTLEADRLVPWHRWLTPVFEPRRFDTYFFLAALPQGQEPHLPPGEADQVRWLTPARALTEHGTGNLPMLPPTIMTLRELSTYDSREEMLAVVRDVSEPFMPDL